MNINDSEGDQVRHRIQKYKKDFDQIRREMRKLQQAHDKKMFSDRSTEDMVSSINSLTF